MALKIPKDAPMVFYGKLTKVFPKRIKNPFSKSGDGFICIFENNYTSILIFVPFVFFSMLSLGDKVQVMMISRVLVSKDKEKYNMLCYATKIKNITGKTAWRTVKQIELFNERRRYFQELRKDKIRGYRELKKEQES